MGCKHFLSFMTYIPQFEAFKVEGQNSIGHLLQTTPS